MLVLCALWGVQQVASKVALTQGMPPVLQAVLRSVLAGPLLLAWLYARQGRAGLATLLERDGSLWPGLATGVLFALEFALLFWGVKITSATHAVILLFSGGFFTAVAAHVLLPDERLRPVHVGGLVLAFAGVTLTVRPGGGDSSLAGDLVVLGAAAAWGLNTVVVKSSKALRRCSAEKVLAYQVLGALPLLLICAVVAGQLVVPDASALAWASVLYQGAVIAFASYLVWFWLVARYPAGKLAAFSFMTPVFGVVAAGVLLHEPLTPLLLAGLALVCAGLVLVNK